MCHKDFGNMVFYIPLSLFKLKPYVNSEVYYEDIEST